MFQPIEDLDPAATLARAQAAVGMRRAAEIEDLQLVAHWADLHGEEPEPGDGRPFSGGDRLVQLGGDGTPPIQELCLPELAIARGTHTLATRSATADVLDLRHRLTQCWMVFLSGDCDAWLVRKVAAMSRRLTRQQIALVDTAVSEALPGESPGRVLRIAEAKVIEADPESHRARLEDELRKRFVRCAPSDEQGLRMVYARIEAGDAAWIDAVVDQVADILAGRPTSPSTSVRTPPRTSFGPSRSAGWPTPPRSPSSSPPSPRRSGLARRSRSTSTCTRPLSKAPPRSPEPNSSARCCSTRCAGSSDTPTSTCIRSSTSPPAPRSTATNTPPR